MAPCAPLRPLGSDFRFGGELVRCVGLGVFAEICGIVYLTCPFIGMKHFEFAMYCVRCVLFEHGLFACVDRYEG